RGPRRLGEGVSEKLRLERDGRRRFAAIAERKELLLELEERRARRRQRGQLGHAQPRKIDAHEAREIGVEARARVVSRVDSNVARNEKIELELQRLGSRLLR